MKHVTFACVDFQYNCHSPFAASAFHPINANVLNWGIKGVVNIHRCIIHFFTMILRVIRCSLYYIGWILGVYPHCSLWKGVLYECETGDCSYFLCLMSKQPWLFGGLEWIWKHFSFGNTWVMQNTHWCRISM